MCARARTHAWVSSSGHACNLNSFPRSANEVTWGEKMNKRDVSTWRSAGNVIAIYWHVRPCPRVICFQRNAVAVMSHDIRQPLLLKPAVCVLCTFNCFYLSYCTVAINPSPCLFQLLLRWLLPNDSLCVCLINLTLPLLQSSDIPFPLLFYLLVLQKLFL